MGHIHAIEMDSDGTEHVYYHYYWVPGYSEETFGEIFYDTHCLTPGEASPVILVCPD